MTTSRAVFAARKEGRLDDAYLMALELMSAEIMDEWDIKAFAWCLIDLIKRDINSRNQQDTGHYLQQLNGLSITGDEVLQNQISFVNNLLSPTGHQQTQAKNLSKEGRHAEAVQLYRQIYQEGGNNLVLKTAFGWELYRLGKQLCDQNKKRNADAIKRILHEYLKLDLEKPSLLHTFILLLAKNLAKENDLKLVPFVRIWGLGNLREEDYKSQEDDKGNRYPSLAESILQAAGKEAINSNDLQLVEFMLPYLSVAIEHFPENIWFKYYKAKGLLMSNKSMEAKDFSLNVCKVKQADSWAWGLVGDVLENSDMDMALACYCKALLCNNEESHKSRLRIKLALILVNKKNFSKAKHEIEQLIKLNEKYALRLENLIKQDWYQTTLAEKSNHSFYMEHAPNAEHLLFEKLPWINANLGERFTVPDTNKHKFKLYVKTGSETIEVSVPQWMMKASNHQEGAPLRIKSELDEQGAYRVYVVENRPDGAAWDAFNEVIGVIDNINHEKKLYHFIVNRHVDGLIPFALAQARLHEGDAVVLKLASFSSKTGKRFRVLKVAQTDKQPETALLKAFICDDVRISGTVGFTETDIFIPPFIVQKYHLSDGSSLSGVAILNFNSKKREWGWKVLKVTA